VTAELWAITSNYFPDEREIDRRIELQWIIREEIDRIERASHTPDESMLGKEEFYEVMRTYMRVIE
jgi:hypothetical protein